MLNTLNQIIVQCPRENTTHMQLTAYGSGLCIEYGKVILGMMIHFLRVGDKEILTYAEHPELFELYDGTGWNTFELFAFVAKQVVIDIEANDSIPVIGRIEPEVSINEFELPTVEQLVSFDSNTAQADRASNAIGE